MYSGFWLLVGTTLCQEFRMKRMVFGPNCYPSTAQFVKNKNANFFERQFPEAVFAIKFVHYVDDYLGSYRDCSSALRISRFH